MGRILHGKVAGNGDKKRMHLLGSTRKRVPSAVEGKSVSKCRVKRCCHSLPNRDEAVGSQGEDGMHSSNFGLVSCAPILALGE